MALTFAPTSSCGIRMLRYSGDAKGVILGSEKRNQPIHVNIHTLFRSSISRTFSEGMRPAVAGFLSTVTMRFSICPTRVVGRRRVSLTERLASLFSH